MTSSNRETIAATDGPVTSPRLVRSVIHLIKFWFSVSREEQRRRFMERKVHPLKQWKLSPVDLESIDKWDDYTRAKEDARAAVRGGFRHFENADFAVGAFHAEDAF